MRNHDQWRLAGKITACCVLVLGLALAGYSFAVPTGSLFPESAARLITTTTCRAEVFKSLLYPQGGIVPVQNAVINKITGGILLDITAELSGNPDEVRGTLQPTVAIAADEYWTAPYLTGHTVNFTKAANGHWVAKTSIRLDLNALAGWLKRMEDDTGLTIGSYRIEVSPGVAGEVVVSKQALPIGAAAPINFNYTSGQTGLQAAADSGVAQTFPIVADQNFRATLPPAPAMLNLWLFALPVALARRLSLALVLLPVCFLLWQPAGEVLRRLASRSEEERIDRRNRNIILIRGGDALQNKPTVELTSFRKLAAMAEQKELPVMKIGMQSPAYVVIDTGMIYRYTPDGADAPHPVEKGGRTIESGAK